MIFSWFLGFNDAWLLLVVGISCIGIVGIVTTAMYLKYIVFDKKISSKFIGIHMFIDIKYFFLDSHPDHV